MGKMKELFAEQLYNDNIDLDDDYYHYLKWARNNPDEMGWVPERDGLTLEDVERETKEENNNNINLNKG